MLFLSFYTPATYAVATDCDAKPGNSDPHAIFHCRHVLILMVLTRLPLAHTLPCPRQKEVRGLQYALAKAFGFHQRVLTIFLTTRVVCAAHSQARRVHRVPAARAGESAL